MPLWMIGAVVFVGCLLGHTIGTKIRNEENDSSTQD